MVIIPGCPARIGPRGALLESAVLQLLPLTLEMRAFPTNLRNRMNFLAGRLVRLTCRGRRGTRHLVCDSDHDWCHATVVDSLRICRQR